MTADAFERSLAGRINAYWLSRGYQAGAAVTLDDHTICVRSALVRGLPPGYAATNGQDDLAVAGGKGRG